MKTNKTNFVLSTLVAVGILSLFFPHNSKQITSGIDLTIDSGWFTKTPTNRSVEVFGQDVNNLFSNRPKNQYANLALYGVESIISFNFEQCSLHEMGHANYSKSKNSPYSFETGDTNFFKYLVNHKLFANAVTNTNLVSTGTQTEVRRLYAAGFNAETQFVEDSNLDITWQIPARFSVWLYRVGGSDLQQIPYSARNMRIAQLLTYAASFFGTEFYSYFNDKNISVRGVHTFGDYTVAVESLVDLKNAEVQVGRKFTYAGVTVTPKVTIGKGINLEGTVEYKNLVVGFVSHSEKTLSGARVPSNEVYAQYRLHF